MKKLATFRNDEKFSEEEKAKLTYEGLREATRTIVFDAEGKIALFGGKHMSLPGGGREKGEELQECAVRECMEEIGCNIEIISEIGIVEDYLPSRNGRHHNYGYVGKVRGEKGQPSSTQEDEKDGRVEWHTPEEALNLLNAYLQELTSSNSETYIHLRACALFLETYLTGLKKR